MSNPVHLQLTVYGFPAEYVEPGATFRGQDFPPQLNLVAMTRATAPRWQRIGSALVWLGASDVFAVEYDDGTLTLAGEVNHGLARLRGMGTGHTTDLLPALRAAGLAYFAAEHEGTFEAWRPGWVEPRVGATLEGEPVLHEADFHRIMREHASVGEGALAVARYFDVAGEVARWQDATERGEPCDARR